MSRPGGWAEKPSAAFTTIAAPSLSRRADASSLLPGLTRQSIDHRRVAKARSSRRAHRPTVGSWLVASRSLSSGRALSGPVGLAHPTISPPPVNPHHVGCPSGLRGVAYGYELGDGCDDAEGRGPAAADRDLRAQNQPGCAEVECPDPARLGPARPVARQRRLRRRQQPEYFGLSLAASE